jgi:hypothetical protein
MMATHLAVAPNVLASHLQGEAVLLHLGTKSYFRLNGTGAHIWKRIEAGDSDDAIVQSLVDAFEVSRDDAAGAFVALRDDLLANKLVIVSASNSDA